MKLIKDSMIKWVTSFLFLTSCISNSLDNQNSFQNQGRSLKENALIEESLLNKYFNSQNLSTRNIESAKIVNRNILKIKSVESFKFNINPESAYSTELIKLIYEFNLPVSISWNKNSNAVTFKNIFINESLGFCSNLYDDTLNAIYKNIGNTRESVLIIYSKKYELIRNKIVKDFSSIDSILLNTIDSQKFASEILGVEESINRFKKITNLSPSQKIKFFPRKRLDKKKIILIIEPNEYKSILPSLKYHGANQFQYINFISSMENLLNSKELLDFENSLIPISFFISNEIKNNNLQSLEKILERSLLRDWVLINILKQSKINSAEINGMTGNLEYKKNACTKRTIPLQSVSSNWVAY